MTRPEWEVADVVRLVHRELFATCDLPYAVRKAAVDIMQCRTQALGGHKSKCSHCSHVSISYNSCRNRHCPKCQFSKREQWVLDRKVDILPVSYFHVVFTVPHQLNPVAKAYPRVLYSILFKAAWRTVKTLSEDPKWLGAKSGMIALLHTWGQNLSLHPHLHCIIPQGGFVPEIKRWRYTRHRKFLFPVRVMSALFRRLFLNYLEEAHNSASLHWETHAWSQLMPELWKSSFNVFAKLPFNGPRQVIEYLGRYSHRVAISNHRIKQVASDQVSFSYKDYSDESEKIMRLKPMEFVRRFLQHVLPKGFAKIRHFGILSNRAKGQYIMDILHFFERRQAQPVTFDPVAHILDKYSLDISLCPVCGFGKMVPHAVIPRSRGDPHTPFLRVSPSFNVITVDHRS